MILAVEANPYLTSLIAVSGTLLGGIVAGTFSLILSSRQLKWQKADAATRYRIETERWAHSILEERDKIIWAERRTLYAKLIAAIDVWTDVIADIAIEGAPKGVQIASLADAAEKFPPAIPLLQSMADVSNLMHEMRIISSQPVISAANNVQKILFKSASDCLDAVKPQSISEAHGKMVQLMRYELSREPLAVHPLIKPKVDDAAQP